MGGYTRYHLGTRFTTDFRRKNSQYLAARPRRCSHFIWYGESDVLQQLILGIDRGSVDGMFGVGHAGFF